jgi:hypothetical protein
MKRELWLCQGCRRQVSITSGTILHDSRLPLRTWFRAIWHFTGQQDGVVRAADLERKLDLGSYRSAWALLHKLRRAMVQPGEDRLRGVVAVEEIDLSGGKMGVKGQLTFKMPLVLVAAEMDGDEIKRIRLRNVDELNKASAKAFVADMIEQGSTIRASDPIVYKNIPGYARDRCVRGTDPSAEAMRVPIIRRVESRLKRWLLEMNLGAIAQRQLGYYLGVFAFRFNCHASLSQGKLFHGFVQQAVAIPPTAPHAILARHF